MKFYQAQEMSAIEILKLLQELTRNNITLMKHNNDEADKLSVDQDNSAGNVVLLKQFYAKNNSLSKQNNLYIQLHTQLLCFLKSLDGNNDLESNDNEVEEKEESHNKPGIDVDFKDCFNKTKEGLVNFDEQHPFFKDDFFRQKLIEIYTENEEYEKCIGLIDNLKSSS